ncbi:hypothetical protein CWI84_10110 [Idiomarina tyrosinivorans]|uniref:Uncharacterized protein n=2 Tax=Idiomarina tyrosinivorans TaxID=1445662 RepID=A0A432ZM40_9GAMM|nr:hypothetical protein CWI84_10110 [Idiomarina tyrosinivorans]
MTEFTPWSAAIGGILIGLGGLVLYLFNGRIAGISGITAGALFQRGGRGWRIAFVAGLVIAPVVIAPYIELPAWHVPKLSIWTLVAGLLVGLGTRWGSGCTSGHGVCGVSRWSMRSLVATIIFMLAGVVIASLFGGVSYVTA